MNEIFDQLRGQIDLKTGEDLGIKNKMNEHESNQNELELEQIKQ